MKIKKNFMFASKSSMFNFYRNAADRYDVQPK